MQNPINTNLQGLGASILRYSLIIILLWIGMFKFIAYGAEGKKLFVSNSSSLSWVYSLVSVLAFALVLGVIEILLGILIAIRIVSPKASAIDCIGSMIMFLINLSFILSRSGIWQAGYEFPFLLPKPGQFILKDILLIGAAIWTAKEVLSASAVETHLEPDHLYSQE